MPMKDSDILDLGKDSNLFLFKGDPTTRKTANAGSFGEPGKPFGIVDIDGKSAAIKVAHPDKKYKWDYFAPSEFNRLEDYMGEIVDKNPFQGGTFVFDSITSYVKMIIHYSLSYRPASKSKDRNEGHKSIGTVEIAGWDEYGTETACLDNLLAALKILSKTCRVILTAHVTGTVIKEQDGQKVVFRPIFTAGKGPAIYIPGQFKEIYHFYLEKKGNNTVYTCVTQSNGIDYASTMLGLPKEIDVTDCKLYDKIKAHCLAKGWSF